MDMPIILVWCTAYNLWTFTWIVHFELPFRLKVTDKIHTEGLSKFYSNIYSILFVYNLHTSLTSLIYKRFYLTFFIKKFIRFNPEFSVLIIYLKNFNFSFSMFLMNCKYPMYLMYSMYTIYLFMNTTSPLI